MAAGDGVYGILGQRYVIGPGSVVRIGNIPRANSASIKIETGGTLEISGLSFTTNNGFTCISGTATIVNSAGPTFGNGYFVSANEIVSANLSGAVYLFVSGATTTVSVGYGRSEGTEVG